MGNDCAFCEGNGKLCCWLVGCAAILCNACLYQSMQISGQEVAPLLIGSWTCGPVNIRNIFPKVCRALSVVVRR